MKKRIVLILFIVLGLSKVYAQDAKTTFNPVGKWQFEAPYAPEGFTDGLIEVALNEAKHVISMSFTGSDYKLPGEQVKFENNVLVFLIYIEGNDITVTLKFDTESKMSGKAVYADGEVPLSLTRIPKKD